MSFTPVQLQKARAQQAAAASDTSTYVRLLAGPGSGKTFTIERRVEWALSSGAAADHVYVISFTRAACEEMTERIVSHLSKGPHAADAAKIHISTMHSLALRILSRGNMLHQFPSKPRILDSYEQKEIFDQELATDIGCTPKRAGQIRLAYDAQWQTLNPSMFGQQAITATERTKFEAFHSTRTNLYSCLLSGEVVYRCEEALRLGNITRDHLPPMKHLIVDEFQDLNNCDQKFINLLVKFGSTLFVCGDDDQSIYAFRHANPDGIMTFPTTYPGAGTHALTDCFRCTPTILQAALTLVARNPQRLTKNMVSAYTQSAPPVNGTVATWSFADDAAEARGIAISCERLIQAGMAGNEDQILILLSNTRVQLPALKQELGNLGIAYDDPKGANATSHSDIRAAYFLLRLSDDLAGNTDDYPSYRGLLGLLSGVGPNTIEAVSNGAISNHENYREIFKQPTPPHWLNAMGKRAHARVSAIVIGMNALNLERATLAANGPAFTTLLSTQVFKSTSNCTINWEALIASLPGSMTFRELLDFLSTEDEVEQERIISVARLREGEAMEADSGPTAVPKRVRIMTIHGSKGLSAQVVFIPSLEQGILPSFRHIQAPGLVIEARRLLYVGLTRAKAACILSHAAGHSLANSMMIRQNKTANLPRSQFLDEMSLQSQNRTSGLSSQEAASIVKDIKNL